jgi:hypothetical protein
MNNNNAGDIDKPLLIPYAMLAPNRLPSNGSPSKPHITQNNRNGSAFSQKYTKKRRRQKRRLSMVTPDLLAVQRSGCAQFPP